MKSRGVRLIPLLPVLLMICTVAGARGNDAPEADVLEIQDAQPVQDVQPPPDTGNAPEPSLRNVMEELVRLREEVGRLRELLDAHLSSEAADLRVENERLRRDLAGQKQRGLSSLPMPDKELLRGLSDRELPGPRAAGKAETPALEETGQEPQAGKNEGQPHDSPPPPAEFKHEILAEWGRTPIDAAKSVPKVGSLKGMICVVPPGSQDEDLTALAQKLHKEFAAYDNINIEVFDDPEAARAFKENRAADGEHAPSEHRVLSISKHGSSGRDVILLLKKDQAVEIPPQQ